MVEVKNRLGMIGRVWRIKKDGSNATTFISCLHITPSWRSLSLITVHCDLPPSLSLSIQPHFHRQFCLLFHQNFHFYQHQHHHNDNFTWYASPSTLSSAVEESSAAWCCPCCDSPVKTNTFIFLRSILGKLISYDKSQHLLPELLSALPSHSLPPLAI